MHELLTHYPITLSIAVAWGDMDAFQHVNNTMYFRYFESARIRYFEQAQLGPALNGIGPILASVQCRFKLPVTYPDTVLVGVRVTQMGADRFVMDHCLVSQRHNKVAAYGDGLIVAYDYQNQRKTSIPPVARSAIEQLEIAVGNIIQPLAPST